MKIAIVLNSKIPISREFDAQKVICADGGYNICPVKADYLIGDLDSILDVPTDVQIVKHNQMKNYTDNEACVHFAKNLGATEIDFYGVLGGRYDHTISNFNVMALCQSWGIKAVAKENECNVYVAQNIFKFSTQQNQTVSIFPFGGECLVDNSKSLLYPLQNLLLTPNDSRGISNVTTSNFVEVNIKEGRALIFHYFKLQR